MSLNLDIEKNGHYLSISASGIRRRRSLVSMARDVIDACAEHSVDTALVDISNLIGRLSICDSYSIATKEFPKLNQLGIVKKVVIVDSGKNNERIQFFGRIARSFGINIQVFTDIEKAKKSMAFDEIYKS